jgi:hypothetical protein
MLWKTQAGVLRPLRHVRNVRVPRGETFYPELQLLKDYLENGTLGYFVETPATKKTSLIKLPPETSSFLRPVR